MYLMMMMMMMPPPQYTSSSTKGRAYGYYPFGVGKKERAGEITEGGGTSV